MGKWQNTFGGRAVRSAARVEPDYRHTTAPPCQGREKVFSCRTMSVSTEQNLPFRTWQLRAD